jgi:DNA-directed RNA polymerase subunit H (RpoH/RPB5)
MTSFKIFQIEKNNEDIRKNVLTNIIKMLTERKLLNQADLEENINKLVNTQSDDHSYIINVNHPDKYYAIKIMHQKITAISKQSGISDFLNKYKDNPKIVVVKGINTKAQQYIMNNYTKTEVFLDYELMINLVDHILVPRYEVLDTESDEFINFRETFHCKKRNIPKLLHTDQAARYYNLKPGNIVRVIRVSETTAYAPFYRLVI